MTNIGSEGRIGDKDHTHHKMLFNIRQVKGEEWVLNVYKARKEKKVPFKGTLSPKERSKYYLIGRLLINYLINSTLASTYLFVFHNKEKKKQHLKEPTTTYQFIIEQKHL